ncbi:SDR family oxidoreductase [Tianweitania populi]|uniref:Short-chain dehydrogenase/reductase n=1 Tax=Tianweitania populi TaxID=1607949 RepID=A0A8J3GKA8_9HYPH|nr:SDR family oxidoreductase [Tianweitania populi]GHD11065.1 short-chain dehydrogenase/reductase [Tianweitania populi]
MASKVWFITGSSKGFGRIWAEAALARGDKVAATARDASTLQPLVDQYGDSVLALTLDVTDKAQVNATIAEAQANFGRLDIVVNNAGYGLFGAVEEVSEEDARAQIETNVFGALWVTQAALPIMREQKAGHIIQVSSIGGVNAFQNVGLYHASKWALEGFSQTLSQEVAGFGIHVTLVEPSGFSTDWGGPSAKHSESIAAYDSVRENSKARRGNTAAGDPEATAEAILKVVDAAEPPLRVFFGDVGLPMIKQEYAKRIALWEEWDHVAVLAQGAGSNRKA